jgi:hypothetical protein
VTEINLPSSLHNPGDKAGISEFDQVERAARRRNLIIATGIGIVLIVAITLMCGLFSKAGPRHADVGSCMTGASADTLQVVDCSSTAAHLKVVGRLNISSEPSNTQMIQDCAPWPTTVAGYYDAGNHFLLCLASLGR